MTPGPLMQHFYSGASEEAAAWDEYLEPRFVTEYQNHCLHLTISTPLKVLHALALHLPTSSIVQRKLISQHMPFAL